MNILYGVQTTGNGHIVRSRSMIKRLRDRGHEIYVVLSGCRKKPVLDLLRFGSFERKEGLTFVVNNGCIDYLKTARQLNLWKFYRDIRSFKTKSFDLVITDYEPITARIARRNGIPSIGLGHLYAFQYDVPVQGKHWFAKWIMKNYAPVDYPVGLHWHHFNQLILPPTIPANVRRWRDRCTNEEYILVYLPFENLDHILPVFSELRKHSFRIYANVKNPVVNGHIRICPFSREEFIEDLAGCSGAICNSGFSFISEALFLGKKILTKPVIGQVEQQSNALAIQQLDLGHVTSTVSPQIVEEWINQPGQDPLPFPDVMSLVAKWIDTGDYAKYQGLVKDAWSETDIPQDEVKYASAGC